MFDENGNEMGVMTKEEADASVKEICSMMKYFDEICEHCGRQRKDCSMNCIEKQINHKE